MRRTLDSALKAAILTGISVILVIQPLISRFLPKRDPNLMANASIISTWGNIIMFSMIFSVGFIFLLRLCVGKDLRPRGAWRLALPAVFLVLSVLSLAYTVEIYASIWEILRLLALAGLFAVILNSLDSKYHIKSFVGLILGIAVVIALYGIIQYFYLYGVIEQMFRDMPAGDPRRNWGLTRSMIDLKRAVSFLDWPNMLAGFLALVMPLSISLSIFNKGRTRAAYIVISIVLLSCMVFTFSIGGWMALFAALILEGVLLFDRWKGYLYKLSAKRRRLAGTASVLFIVVFVAVVGSVILNKRLNPITAASVKGRLAYQKAAFRMVKDHPLIGTGIGTFGRVYPKYMISRGAATRHAHNTYLEIFSELGILGFLSISLFFLAILRTGMRLSRRCEDEYYRFLSIGLTCGLLSFMLHNIIEFTFYHSTVSLFWWASAALLFKIDAINSKEAFSGPSLSPILLSPFFVLLIFIFVFLSRSYISESHFASSVDYNIRGRFFEARDELRQSVSLNGINPAYRLLLGTVNLRLYDKTKDRKFIDEALSDYKRASRLSPHMPDGHYGASIVYLKLGELKRAQQEAGSALSLAPTSATYQGLLGFLNKQ